MPNHERLMILIDTMLTYALDDSNCKKCPCCNTEYCKIKNNGEWEDFECRDGVYEWVMNH